MTREKALTAALDLVMSEGPAVVVSDAKQSVFTAVLVSDLPKTRAALNFTKHGIIEWVVLDDARPGSRFAREMRNR